MNRPTPGFVEVHARACADGRDHYIDPQTGYLVMTSVYLRAQDGCCGNGCRHCPWPRTEQLRAGRPERSPAWPWPATHERGGS